jgi:hypothetical protein
MNLWMPSAANRTVFAADGPLNNAIRDAIDAKLRNKPMPTLIVRQTGEAWTHPFVAVYEPSLASETTIRAVRSLKTDAPDGNVVATEVVGPGYRVRLFNDATASGTAHTADDAAFQGLFAAVVEHADGIDEAYLGDGTNLQVGGIALASADGNPVSACIRRTGSAWTYSSTAAVKITLPVSPSKTYAAAKDAPLPV